MAHNLKSVIIIILMLVASGITSAQNKTEWKEMVEFHKVMSQTFHPAEEGNFLPIRERSGEMFEKAIAWKTSIIPAEYSNIKGIKKNLKQLVKKSSELERKIKANGTDEIILADLTVLHDIFHNIVGLCNDEH
jgi:hypothetical protein